MNRVFICAAGTCGLCIWATNEMPPAQDLPSAAAPDVGAKLFGKFTMHDGNIDPDLFKHTAMHQAHFTTATTLTVPALPVKEPAG